MEKLENAIQEVSRKSVESLSQWKKSNPDYEDMDSEFSKKCIPMQQNSMGLCNKSTFYPKIIHNLAKENATCHLYLFNVYYIYMKLGFSYKFLFYLLLIVIIAYIALKYNNLIEGNKTQQEKQEINKQIQQQVVYTNATQLDGFM